MTFILYVVGIVVIILSYGAWCSLTTSRNPEQYAGFVWLGVWIWPIALPFILLFYLGSWLGNKIKEYLR
jgi:hypothetical protein